MRLIDPDWSFEEAVNNIKEVRAIYEGILCSFLYEEIKQRNKFVRSVKDAIYDLKFSEWKKDRIWNYMNRYEPLYVLKDIINRQKQRKML